MAKVRLALLPKRDSVVRADSMVISSARSGGDGDLAFRASARTSGPRQPRLVSRGPIGVTILALKFSEFLHDIGRIGGRHSGRSLFFADLAACAVSHHAFRAIEVWALPGKRAALQIASWLNRTTAGKPELNGPFLANSGNICLVGDPLVLTHGGHSA